VRPGSGKRYLSVESHIRMMAAAQPVHLGRHLRRPINMPNDATVETARTPTCMSWQLALKANAALPRRLRSCRSRSIPSSSPTMTRRRRSHRRGRAQKAGGGACRGAAERIVERIVERAIREREKLPQPAQGLYPEGDRRRAQGVSAHRRI
jgi:ribonucleoside-diphosphate reductase alpha chain